MSDSVQPTVPLKTEAGVVMGFKVVRIALAYLSLTIATNFMTQIYMEKVLVNNEAPPPLLNFVWLFMFVDVLVNVLFVLVIMLMENFSLFGNAGGHQITAAYLMDYGVSLVLLLVLACIVANTMYNKKYFLYKDDGLRSIRALSEIVFNVSIMIHILPYGLLLKLLTGSSFADVPAAPVAAAATATATAPQPAAATPPTAGLTSAVGGRKA